MEESKAVQLVEENGGLKFTDEDGKTTQYRQELHRRIYVEARSLSLGDSIEDDDESATAQWTTRSAIHGSAVLEDRSISVIGNPESKTKRIALEIRPESVESHAKSVDRAQRHQKEHFTKEILPGVERVLGFYDANLYYFPADFEIGNESYWTLVLRIAEETFNELAEAVLLKRLIQFKVSAIMRGAYIQAHHEYVPFSMKIDWFLRPHQDNDGNVDLDRLPEQAFGKIDSWNTKYATVELPETVEPEPTVTTDADVNDEPRKASDAENTLAALERITAAVTSLGTKVISAAWLLAIALVIVAFIK